MIKNSQLDNLNPQEASLPEHQSLPNLSRPWEGMTPFEAAFPVLSSLLSSATTHTTKHFPQPFGEWFSGYTQNPRTGMWEPIKEPTSYLEHVGTSIARIPTNPWYWYSLYQAAQAEQEHYELKKQLDPKIEAPSLAWSIVRHIPEETAKWTLAEAIAYPLQQGISKGIGELTEGVIKSVESMAEKGYRAGWLLKTPSELIGGLGRAGRIAGRIGGAASSLGLSLIVPTPISVGLAIAFDVADDIYKFATSSSWDNFLAQRRSKILAHIDSVGEMMDELNRRGWYDGAWSLLSVPFPSIALSMSATRELLRGDWRQAGYLFHQSLNVGFPGWIKDSIFVLIDPRTYITNKVIHENLNQLAQTYVGGSFRNLAHAAFDMQHLFSASTATSSDAFEDLAKDWVMHRALEEKNTNLAGAYVASALGGLGSQFANAAGQGFAGGLMNILASTGQQIPAAGERAQAVQETKLKPPAYSFERWGPGGSIYSQEPTTANRRPVTIESYAESNLRRMLLAGPPRNMEIIVNNEYWQKLASQRLDMRRLLVLRQRFGNAVELLNHEYVNDNVYYGTKQKYEIIGFTFDSIASAWGTGRTFKEKLIEDLASKLKEKFGDNKEALKEYVNNIYGFSEKMLESYKKSIENTIKDKNELGKKLEEIKQFEEKFRSKKEEILKDIDAGYRDPAGAIKYVAGHLIDGSYSGLLRDLATIIKREGVSGDIPQDYTVKEYVKRLGQLYKGTLIDNHMKKLLTEGRTVSADKGVELKSHEATNFFNVAQARLRAETLKDLTHQVIFDSLTQENPAAKAFRLITLSSTFHASDYDPIQVMAVSRLLSQLVGKADKARQNGDWSEYNRVVGILNKITGNNASEAFRAVYASMGVDDVFSSPIKGLNGGAMTLIEKIKQFAKENKDFEKIYTGILSDTADRILGLKSEADLKENLKNEYVIGAVLFAALDGRISPEYISYALNGQQLDTRKSPFDKPPQATDLSGNTSEDILRRNRNERVLSINLGRDNKINVLDLVSDNIYVRSKGEESRIAFQSRFLNDRNRIRSFWLLREQWLKAERDVANAVQTFEGSPMVPAPDQIEPPHIRGMQRYFDALRSFIDKEKRNFEEASRKDPMYRDEHKAPLIQIMRMRVNTMERIYNRIYEIYQQNKDLIEQNKHLEEDFRKLFVAIAAIEASKTYFNEGGELHKILSYFEDYFAIPEKIYSKMLTSHNAQQIRGLTMIVGLAEGNSVLAKLLESRDIMDENRKRYFEQLSRTTLSYSRSSLEAIVKAKVEEYESKENKESKDKKIEQQFRSLHDLINNPNFKEFVFSTFRLAHIMRERLPNDESVSGHFSLFIGPYIGYTDPTGELENRTKKLLNAINEVHQSRNNGLKQQSAMLGYLEARENYLKMYRLIQEQQIPNLEDIFRSAKDAEYFDVEYLYKRVFSYLAYTTLLERHGAILSKINDMDKIIKEIRGY